MPAPRERKAAGDPGSRRSTIGDAAGVPGLQTVAVTGGFLALAAVLFAAAMTANLAYDEEQYVAAGYFARELAIYRDFIAFQPPAYSWLLAAVFELTGGWYLLTARVLTWVFGLGACLLLYSLTRSYGAGRAAGFVLVLGFVTSPFLAEPLTLSRNDIVPLFLLLLGLRLCIDDIGLTASAWRAMAGGLALGLAAATKYLYLFAPPLLACMLLYVDHTSPAGRFRWRRTAAFAGGAALGALPVLYALAANGERFVLETLRFHLTAVFDWYQAQGLGEMLTLEYKLATLPGRLLRNGNAVIMLVLGLSTVSLLVFGRGAARRVEWGTAAAAVAVLLAGALAIGIKVGPFNMYYAPVAALGALLAARAFARARRLLPGWLGFAMLAVSLIPAWSGLMLYADRALASTNPDYWTGIQAHRSALRVAGAIAAHGAAGHVATLFPIPVLDANPVLPNFSAGPFFFRSAGSYTIEEVEGLRGAGPATLDRLFARAPPAAIVAGYGPFPLNWKPPMDAALLEYAQRNGYVPVARDWKVKGYPGGQVWVRPARPQHAAGRKAPPAGAAVIPR